jgi:hypothetical protein
MRKTIALLGAGAALALLPVAAAAQTGYGVVPGQPSSTPFERSFNQFNQSKAQARAGSAYVRHHSGMWHPRYRHTYHPYL